MSRMRLTDNATKLKELYEVAKLMMSDRAIEYEHIVDSRSRELFLAEIPEGSSQRENFCA